MIGQLFSQFGIWLVVGIVVLYYYICHLQNENERLRMELYKIECRQEMEPEKPPSPKDMPRKSRELYAKINSICQNKLGISARDLVLGAK